MCRAPANLWIDRTKVGMQPHNDAFACKGNHRSSRHRQVWNNRPNIAFKDVPHIKDDLLSGVYLPRLVYAESDLARDLCLNP
jgi:hypothetical protein